MTSKPPNADADEPPSEALAIATERSENGTLMPAGRHAIRTAPRRRAWFLRPKWLSAIFQGIAAFGTVGALVFLSIQSHQTQRALEQAEKATIAAQQQVEISDRAWVQSRVSLAGPFIVEPSGSVSFRVAVALRNVGRSVANHLTVTTESFGSNMTGGDDFFTNPAKRQKEVCDAARARGKSSMTASTLFPDEEEIQPLTHVTNAKNLFGGFPPDLGAQLNMSMPTIVVLVGCVTYWYESSDRPHQTGFIYQLTRRAKLPEIPGIIVTQRHFIDVGTPAVIPFQDLELQRFFMGGFYAD